jgi:hypothetical protein
MMPMDKLAWGTRVSSAFRDKVLKICADFGWSGEHANWLMACMAFESGETFSASIKNAAGSGACGLIQFMPSTAESMGYSIKDLECMTPEAQLDVVKRYFKPYHKRIGSLSDMYMAILLPKYVGQDESVILLSKGVSYRQNSGLDANRDGKITKAEATAKVLAKYKKGMKEPYFYRFSV